MPFLNKLRGFSRLGSALVLTLLILSGCAGGERNAVILHKLPDTDYSSDLQAAMASSPRYLMGPGDRLEIKFIGNENLNSHLLISPDGFITVPMIAEPIQCTSLSVNEVQDKIIGYLSQYIIDPMIYLNLLEVGSKYVYVLGNVNNPRKVSTEPLTLASVISECGGIHKDGQRKQIYVLRRNPGGEPLVFEINFMELLKGNSLAPDIPLQRYDIVIVPRSKVATWRDFVQATFSTNQAILRFGLEAIWVNQAIRDELDYFNAN